MEKTILKKGQAGALVGLLIVFIMVAIFSILLSPLIEFVDIGVVASENATNGALIGTTMTAIPVFIALTLLISAVILITGR